MRKLLFVVMAVLAVTTACGSNAGTDSSKSEKQESMETKETTKVVHLTKDEFLQKVYNYEKNPNEWKYEGDKPAIVDFYATWCGPCKMMHPILEIVKSRVGDKARIVKIDVDEQQALAMQYRIQAVPTLMLFKNGQQVWRQSGVVQSNELVSLIEQYV